MEVWNVTIDGEPATLTHVGSSQARGEMYNTAGNRAQHSFPMKLTSGAAFRTNGCEYRVLGKVPHAQE